MEIIITKGNNRNTLTCKRENNTTTSLNLGPDLPNHDIAHYVIETKFNMKKGFYGAIKSGMSIEELSDKNTIKKLGSESWLAEIMTRNLQGIGSGAVAIEQFIALVKWEAKGFKNMTIPEMDINMIKDLKTEFDYLCDRWDKIPEGAQLNLTF